MDVKSVRRLQEIEKVSRKAHLSRFYLNEVVSIRKEEKLICSVVLALFLVFLSCMFKPNLYYSIAAILFAIFCTLYFIYFVENKKVLSEEIDSNSKLIREITEFKKLILANEERFVNEKEFELKLSCFNKRVDALHLGEM